MAPALTAAGAAVRRFTHASGLRAVERELATMHRELLRASGAEPGALRLPLLTLVAACIDDADVAVATGTIEAIAEHHTLRAIILVAHPDDDVSIEADVALHCSIAGAGQVCAEQVHLVVNGEPAFHLASVVTPLLVPDKPVFLWLIGAPPVRQALSSDAIAICERLILDSGAYPDAISTITQLAGELGGKEDLVDVADLAWERLHDWRGLVASCFEGEELSGFQRGIRAVEVESCGAAPSTQAWLLAGWLGSRLSWPEPPALDVTVREVEDVELHDLTRVVLRCTRGDTDATITCARRADTLTADIDVHDGPHVQRAVPFSPGDTVRMVTRLLEGSPGTRQWHRALVAAATLTHPRR